MKNKNRIKTLALAVGMLGGLSLAPAAIASNLPAMGEGATDWETFVTYENHTAQRKGFGLSKFRNTLQADVKRGLGDGWKFFGRFRGSWDGVYQFNSSDYGDKAGGSIMSQSTTPGGYVDVPWGGNAGPIVTKDLANGLGLTDNKFLNDGGSPNEGLMQLGQHMHGIDGGVSMAVPVRPCDKDKRGCRDFGGYGDLKKRELAFPEFNDRLDFLRELYVDKTFSLSGGTDMFVRVGRQQIVWGRTDLFRVLDVLNPVDYSRNNIYDELVDIRFPMWMAQAEWRFGASESMAERNFQLVWNFDKPRPNNLGQCGQPNAILDAGCFFRGMANLWDNGGTVANFANVAPGTLLATNFGPGQIGINEVETREWKLSNTQVGAKFEGITADGLSFSVNAASIISQLPSLHGGKRGTNAFINEYRNAWPYLISFDMHYPRVNLLGGSLDLPIGPGVMRLEAAHTWGEEFANTLREELYSRNRVFRSVVGWDMPIDVPGMTNAFISTQLFYQHIFGHERGIVNDQFYLGEAGIPDWKDNYILTFLVRGSMMNDMLAPQLIFAHDFKADASAIAPQLEWKVSPKAKWTIGANYKWTSGDTNRWSFDDCRACNPWGPFTAPNGDPNPMTAYSRGLSGIEPLGRFRAGPIGSAFNEDEVFVKFNYQF